MEINDYAEAFMRFRLNPDKIRELAEQLQEEHGKKESARPIQCRVSLKKLFPEIVIRDNLTPVSLSFVLGVLIADRPITEQRMQGYVLDLNTGHSLLLTLFSDYAARLHSFMDHDIVIEES